MFEIDDYQFEHINLASSPVGHELCDIFSAVVQFVFY